MDFSRVLRSRREALNLGVRETARLTERPFVPFPIKSAIYISRLENKVDEEMKAESISIDKLWALGVALQISPLVLLAESRELAGLLEQIPTFSVRDCEKQHFSSFLKNRRKELDLTLANVHEMSARVSPWSIGSAYLSQIETDDDGISARVSAEKLWTLGRVLDVDPLLLYVMSRNIDPRYLSSQSRDRLFS